mgnify:CR=1 FL=1
MADFRPVMATITAPDAETAQRLARRLVEDRLAACVQTVDPIRSIYRWQGRVHEEPEVLLLVKTAEPLIPRIEALLREIHPYEVPELACLPITCGSAAYLKWLQESL